MRVRSIMSLLIALDILLLVVLSLIWLMSVMYTHLDIWPFLFVYQVAKVLFLLFCGLEFSKISPVCGNFCLVWQLRVIEDLEGIFNILFCSYTDLIFHELAESTPTKFLWLLLNLSASLSIIHKWQSVCSLSQLFLISPEIRYRADQRAWATG